LDICEFSFFINIVIRHDFSKSFLRMCGILFGIGDVSPWIEENRRRGPDYYDSIKLGDMEFHGCVLHLRGLELAKQPVRRNRNILLFNGEIYNGVELGSRSDTLVFMDLLESCESESGILKVLSTIQGEWAFIYYRADMNTVYFGRDPLGRRALLWHHHPFVLSSVSRETDPLEFWEEVPTAGIHKLMLDSHTVNLVTWNECPDLSRFNFLLNMAVPEDEELQPVINKDELPLPSQELQQIIDSTLEKIRVAVRRRVDTIPPPTPGDSRLAILFSGGLDCMLLSILAHEFIPKNESIDLLNVSFENPRSLKAGRRETFEVPDRKTGLGGYEELRKAFPEREWRFVQVNVTYAECLSQKQRVLSLMKPLETVMDLSIAIAFWFASRGIGYVDDVEYTSKAKVLFSGLGADEQVSASKTVRWL
jgi:asparagine synthetase B (glutamine-hydrolysing)